MAKWLKDVGPESDIVISSRIRIARNIEGIPFPHTLKKEKALEIIENIYNTLLQANSNVEKNFSLIKMEDIDQIQRLNYIEKHLISPALAKNISSGAVLINQEETIGIMINEEDHIRIQCLLPGLQLDTAWELGDKIDDLLEERINYAFDEQLGYLTSCPTNVGTGIRASVMMHLPALSLTGYIHNVLQVAGQIGLAVRGIYGEGTEAAGNIYQVSNQVSLGVSEEEIMANLHDVTLQIIHSERIAREKLLKEKATALEDKVFRSYGILKNARLLTSNEAMQLISDVKLGVNLEIIPTIPLEKLNELIAMIQPGCLQKYFNKELTGIERDMKRAQLVRESL